MQGPDWVTLAQAFSNLGFFALAGYLLWERFEFTKRAEEREDKRQSELIDAVRKETEMHQSLRDQIDVLSVEVRQHSQEHRLTFPSPAARRVR